MKIFSFWDSGRENAPAVVKNCLRSWEEMNPDATLDVFSAADIPRLLGDFPFDVRRLPIQAQADILRVRLLRLNGGIWVDATLLPVVPLSHWKDLYCGTAGFFVYSASPRHWRMANYLIMAGPENYFIRALDQKIFDYWTHPRTTPDMMPRIQPNYPIGRRKFLKAITSPGLGLDYVRFFNGWRRDLLYPVSPEGAASRFFPYFWEQYLMMQLAQTDPEASAIVDAMTYRQHELSHSLQIARESLGSDFPKAIPMALRTAPVQKLDWRVDWPAAVFDRPAPADVLI